MLRAAILVTICSWSIAMGGCTFESAHAESGISTPLGERVWQTSDPVPLTIDPQRAIVNIGVGPWLTRATQSKDFEPILNWLEESTGFDCVLNISPNYDSLKSDLLAGHIDVAILSAAAYADILNEPNANTTYIATVVAGEDSSRDSFYRGYIFTHADNQDATLESLKGQPFAFVDKGSSSGFQYPMAMFLEAGIKPNKDFKSVFYLGSHDRVVSAVANGQVYAGAVWDATLLKAKENGGKFKVITETGRIPREAWVAASAVKKEVAAAVRAALIGATLETETKAGQPALGGGYLYSGFKIEGPDFYKGVGLIRDVLKQYNHSLVKGE
ncbi:MAG: phosphate/phosphite/phosphonate ABC transporter substrate-binding protein [Deltaproteobacteria bacterium]|jgi:phosphonate transport system substrate-binding protein|nr:phosphate/phosphite/phosphonate ABC transporter substrate-binding protein [Deltaproteobacteria bacterium]MBT6488906.1 phosphate/phosphite/phosphonate ABC transporter substrate-binding protein [Deltaproteobacteria bacterium]